MKFAVIGGDLRQIKLAQMLADDGNEVRSFAQGASEFNNVITTADVASAINGVDCIILPTPVSKRGGVINTPRSREIHTMSGLFSKVSECQMVLGGSVDKAAQNIAGGFGIEIIDCLKREELTIKNAVLTAEGALKIILEETEISVLGAKILVVGYGRIGKALCRMLSALGADVTVSARKESDIAWASSCGYKTVRTDEILNTMSQYDVVINTVPAQVISRKCLSEMENCRLCLDLASRPGGVDFDAAAELGVHTVWALGLPGETAPESAALAIKDTIYNILKEIR